jgi:hypothetical protein
VIVAIAAVNQLVLMSLLNKIASEFIALSCGVGPEEVVLPNWIRGVEVASNRAKRRFCPHRYCLEGINAATIRTVPRANRYIVPGRVYHLTHRCHDRQFLFKFARDRDRYRRLLWSTLRALPTSVFAYCITSEEPSNTSGTSGMICAAFDVR